jgi:hypothetical protein
MTVYGRFVLAGKANRATRRFLLRKVTLALGDIPASNH